MSITPFSASFTGVVDSIRSLQIVKDDAELEALLIALTNTAGDLTTRASNAIAALEAYRDSQCPPKTDVGAMTEIEQLLGGIFGALNGAASVEAPSEPKQTEPQAATEGEAEAPKTNPFSNLLMHFEGRTFKTSAAAIAQRLNELSAKVTAGKPSSKFDFNALMLRGLQLAETGYDAFNGSGANADGVKLDFSLLQHPAVQEIAGELGLFSLIPTVMSLSPSIDEIGAAYKRNRRAGIGAAAIAVVVSKAADKAAIGGTEKVASYLEGQAVKVEAKLLVKLVKALEIEAEALVDACHGKLLIAQARCYAAVWQHGKEVSFKRQEFSKMLGALVGNFAGRYISSVGHVQTPMGCSVNDLLEMLSAQFPAEETDAPDTSTESNDEAAEGTLDPNAVIEPLPCLIGDHAAGGPENPATTGTDTEATTPLDPNAVIEPLPCLIGDHAASGPENPAPATPPVDAAG